MGNRCNDIEHTALTVNLTVIERHFELQFTVEQIFLTGLNTEVDHSPECARDD